MERKIKLVKSESEYLGEFWTPEREEDEAVLDDLELAVYQDGAGMQVYDWVVERLGTEFTVADAEALADEVEAAEEAREAVRAAKLVKCACGHMSAHPMTTARGTACERCYDKWSF